MSSPTRAIPPAPATPDSPLPAPAHEPRAATRAYGRPFWLAYVANTLLMVGIALLFRYADLIAVLGGTEFHLGWIVGIGTVGALVMRLLLGLAIDHYGARAVWVSSAVMLSASCFAHLAVSSCTAPAIYLLRIVFTCSVAGVMGASMTFVSARVPPVRVAELVGMLGTAGFLGMILGTQLGDFLLGTETIRRSQVDWMFAAAGLLMALSAGFACLATWGSIRPRPRARPPLWTLLRQYHPGMVLVVGVAMGIALGMPATFLRTYAFELDITKIGLFFVVYAPAALATRVLTRKLPERFGTKPMILAGAAAIVLSQFLFLPVREAWHLVIPGVSYGIGHGLMFPSVVGAGTRTFPSRHRGLAMLLVQGTWDMGQLIGAPAAGLIVEYSSVAGLPAYPTLFISLAAMMACVAVLYGRSHPREAPQPGAIVAPQDTPLPQTAELT